MQNLVSARFNITVVLSLLILLVSGCNWFDNRGGNPESDVNGLAGLSVSEGSLSPAFNFGTTTYTVDVENTVESIQVTAVVEHTKATVTVNGVKVVSGQASDPISLSVGDTAISVVITAENGVSRTFTITVTRAEPIILSDNADLSNMSISSGDLIPVFSSATISYSVSVENAVDSVTLTPTVAESNATLLVNSTTVDSGTASGAIALNVGANDIVVVVTAEDGTTEKTYTVTVTRDDPLSNNADLSGLTFSTGSLTPVFSSGVTDYTSSVDFSTISITATATLSDTNATVTIQGVATSSGSASSTIALLEGDNTITVIVLAEDGVTTKTYTVILTRQAAATFAEIAYLVALDPQSNKRFGWRVSLSADTLAVAAPGDNSGATGVNGDPFNSGGDANSGAVYVFTKDANDVWSLQAYIKASNPWGGDNFGHSIDLDGDLLVVGAIHESSAATGVNGDQADDTFYKSGAAYVFSRDVNQEWSQQAYLKASNTGADDQFGYSVAISGMTIVVGAVNEESTATGINGDQLNNSSHSAGAAYVFTFDGADWSQQAYIKSSTNGWNDWFGNSMALSGDTLAVSQIDLNDNRGGVFIFVRDAIGNWSEQAFIRDDNTEDGDFFGASIDLDGDLLAIGARYEESISTGMNGDPTDNSAIRPGAAYIFERDSNSNWNLQAYIKSSNSEGGEDAFFNPGDLFGFSVSISGDMLVVGAINESSNSAGVDGDESDNSLDDSGAAYVFVRDTFGVWTQQHYLKASNPIADDNFGYGVAVDGNSVAVGASVNVGGAYVYRTQ